MYSVMCMPRMEGMRNDTYSGWDFNVTESINSEEKIKFQITLLVEDLYAFERFFPRRFQPEFIRVRRDALCWVSMFLKAWFVEQF